MGHGQDFGPGYSRPAPSHSDLELRRQALLRELGRTEEEMFGGAVPAQGCASGMGGQVVAALRSVSECAAKPMAPQLPTVAMAINDVRIQAEGALEELNRSRELLGLPFFYPDAQPAPVSEHVPDELIVRLHDLAHQLQQFRGGMEQVTATVRRLGVNG